MKEVCESSRLSFSPRKTRPGERPSGSCLVTCSSILFIYFLPSSIDLRLSLTHCHRAADHHLTFFSSQIYTKYWIFPPLTESWQQLTKHGTHPPVLRLHPRGPSVSGGWNTGSLSRWSITRQQVTHLREWPTCCCVYYFYYYYLLFYGDIEPPGLLTVTVKLVLPGRVIVFRLCCYF